LRVHAIFDVAYGARTAEHVAVRVEAFIAVFVRAAASFSGEASPGASGRPRMMRALCAGARW